ncbi:MAG: hypothetical protein NWF13_03820 [Candidatus Bathyarchaeota archaeon]|nr:hypothetical protein [Candidatus Bathyarchaeota archaeon]
MTSLKNILHVDFSASTRQKFRFHPDALEKRDVVLIVRKGRLIEKLV